MSAIARRLVAIRPDVTITVIGTALDDMALMRSGNAFVTGAVDAEEFEHLVDAYDLRYLFISATRPLFGHPVLRSLFRAICRRPTSTGRWSASNRIKKICRSIRTLALDDIMGALTDGCRNREAPAQEAKKAPRLRIQACERLFTAPASAGFPDTLWTRRSETAGSPSRSWSMAILSGHPGGRFRSRAHERCNR